MAGWNEAQGGAESQPHLTEEEFYEVIGEPSFADMASLIDVDLSEDDIDYLNGKTSSEIAEFMASRNRKAPA